MHSFPDLNEYI